MQTTTRRLHPLVAVAAISVTILAGAGVAALAGLLPASKGQENVLQLPGEVAKPLAPAISHPVTRPAAAKPVARKTAAELPEQPVLPGQLAVVESVREVKAAGDAKGVGAVAGGVVGGVLGNKLGKGKGLVTILGAAGGAFAGHQVEKQVRAEKRWETAVRLDDGSQRTLSSDAEPAWRAGDRVRVVNDRLERA